MTGRTDRAVRRPGPAHGASPPRASPTPARPAASTAATCARCSTASASSRSTPSTCSCAARSCRCSPASARTPARCSPTPLDDGELFEYWAHMAAIVPSAQHRLFRWRMDARPPVAGRGAGSSRDRPAFIDEVLERIRDERADHRRRPRAARRAEGPVVGLGRRQARPRVPVPPRAGGRPPAAQRLRPPLRPARAGAAGGRAGRRRRRPRPRPARSCSTWPAARSAWRTLEDLTDYHRQGTQPCRPLVAELVEEGRLLPAARRGLEPAGLRPPPTPRSPRRVRGRALLSPFDSLVWNRDRTERLFDFHYRIEIYTPPPKRVYGYYVLPFLLDGRLVGPRRPQGRPGRRRAARAGRLRRARRADEPRSPRELAEELRSMAGWLELDVVATTDRGELAPALRAGRRRRAGRRDAA